MVGGAWVDSLIASPGFTPVLPGTFVVPRDAIFDSIPRYIDRCHGRLCVCVLVVCMCMIVLMPSQFAALIRCYPTWFNLKPSSEEILPFASKVPASE